MVPSWGWRLRPETPDAGQRLGLQAGFPKMPRRDSEQWSPKALTYSRKAEPMDPLMVDASTRAMNREGNPRVAPRDQRKGEEQ